MNKKQEKFYEEFTRSLNPREAARKAEYKNDTYGYKLVNQGETAQRIREELMKIYERGGSSEQKTRKILQLLSK